MNIHRKAETFACSRSEMIRLVQGHIKSSGGRAPEFAAQQVVNRAYRDRGFLEAMAMEIIRVASQELNEAEIGQSILAGNGQKARAVSASLNDEDVGQRMVAGHGQGSGALSSSLNGNAAGHVVGATNGHFGAAPAFPSHSNGSGHPLLARNGQESRATPLLPVGEDVGHSRSAGNGLPPSATSSPLNRDGGGQMDRAAKGQTSPSVPYREPDQANRDARFKALTAMRGKLDTSIWGRLEQRFQIDWRRIRVSELHRIEGMGGIAKIILRENPHANPHAFLGADDDRLGIPRLLSDEQMAKIVKRFDGEVAHAG